MARRQQKAQEKQRRLKQFHDYARNRHTQIVNRLRDAAKPRSPQEARFKKEWVRAQELLELERELWNDWKEP
jgi:hypothetical protein